MELFKGQHVAGKTLMVVGALLVLSGQLFGMAGLRQGAKGAKPVAEQVMKQGSEAALRAIEASGLVPKSKNLIELFGRSGEFLDASLARNARPFESVFEEQAMIKVLAQKTPEAESLLKFLGKKMAERSGGSAKVSSEQVENLLKSGPSGKDFLKKAVDEYKVTDEGKTLWEEFNKSFQKSTLDALRVKVEMVTTPAQPAGMPATGVSPTGVPATGVQPTGVSVSGVLVKDIPATGVPAAGGAAKNTSLYESVKPLQGFIQPSVGQIPVKSVPSVSTLPNKEPVSAAGFIGGMPSTAAGAVTLPQDSKEEKKNEAQKSEAQKSEAEKSIVQKGEAQKGEAQKGEAPQVTSAKTVTLAMAPDQELLYRNILLRTVQAGLKVEDSMVRQWVTQGGPVKSTMSVENRLQKCGVLFSSYNSLREMAQSNGDARGSLERLTLTILTVLGQNQDVAGIQQRLDLLSKV